MAIGVDRHWQRSGPCAAPFAVDRDPSVRIGWPVRYRDDVAGSFAEPLRQGLAVVGELDTTEIPQHYDGVVVAEADLGGRPFQFAIDYSDSTAVAEACAAEVRTYFKLQFLREGYPDSPNVVPGGYVANSPFVYGHWCRLRRLRASARPTADAFCRFGLRWGAADRRAATELLARDPRLRFTGGTRLTQHGRYLREMARARVCVDMPGQGPFCSRLIEGLAMGSCVVAKRHETTLPVDLRDGVEIVYCADDLSDLADLCSLYASDEEKRASVEAAASRYFDDHLHPARIAAHIIDELRRGTTSSDPERVPPERRDEPT